MQIASFCVITDTDAFIYSSNKEEEETVWRYYNRYSNLRKRRDQNKEQVLIVTVARILEDLT